MIHIVCSLNFFYLQDASMTSHSINLISDSDEDEEMIFLNHQSLGKRSRNAESQDGARRFSV